ncbi:hypothetical protein DS742_19155 [Lacrimispora amygdalina]|uniref:Uncharacterized protein n=1 Tax=Lacrimispora amygdalina TaxID=253257 RepID=A0A3E2N8R7_9FIRM|nr:hypothetical protein [Clostridium indicum]RFZ77310.1 hypothetical protein DS742_19155 [Clostridium indicum]
MGKIWMPGGGGGADLDVVTAGTEDVLAGKVTVDKDGEPAIGTMPKRGSAVHGSGTGLNQQGLYYYIPKGYYDEGSLTPWVYMTRPEVAAALGVEAWKMRADQNICGVQGSIPLQNPEIANTDHMWATNYSNFGDGNYFLGIRNGYYNNGVSWVRGYNANFVASNIKKGVNVAGVVGTFEGYVPTATDLYLRGNNIKNWYKLTTKGTVTFDSGQISIAGAARIETDYLNLRGFNWLNIEGYTNTNAGVYKQIRLWQLTSSSDNMLSIVDVTNNQPGNYVISLNVSAQQVDGAMYLSFDVLNGAIYRIWLS